MTKSQIIAILKKHAIIPNQSRTKFFISEDKIPELAGEIMKLNKSSFVPPTLQEVKDYAKLKGYNEECAIKAFDYYTEMEWIDNNGKQVKSWKGKMVSVWFREEFKIQTPKSGGMVY